MERTKLSLGGGIRESFLEVTAELSLGGSSGWFPDSSSQAAEKPQQVVIKGLSALEGKTKTLNSVHLIRGAASMQL